MSYSRQWAIAALGLGVGLVSAAACDRREQEARGVEPGQQAGGEQGARQDQQARPYGDQGAQQGQQGAQPGQQGAQPGQQGAQPGQQGAQQGQQGAQQGQQGAQQQGQAAMPPDRIVTAKCEREQRCGNLGAGKTHASMDACVKTTRQQWGGELGAFQCPGGVDQGELEDCLSSIRDQDCGKAITQLSTLDECRATNVCKTAP